MINVSIKYVYDSIDLFIYFFFKLNESNMD